MGPSSAARASPRNVLRNANFRAPDPLGQGQEHYGWDPAVAPSPGPQGDVGTQYRVSISDLERQRGDITPKQSFGKKIMISIRNRI